MNEESLSTSFDTHLDALGHIDRRRLLLALLDANTEDELPVEVGQLAHDTAETSLSMHHVHVPKLDEYDFVDAGPDHDVVTTGPRFEEIEPLLELFDEHRGQLPDGWPSQSPQQ